jgi:NADH pyrophosphatase NudC (nudix superfamily)
MAIGSILLGVALFVLVGLFLAHPFLRPQEEAVALTEQQLLLEEKEAILDQIQTLDFDHETGKIPTELHTHQRAQLMEQATAVLQALDEADSSPIVAHTADQAADLDTEMEAIIAQIRRQPRQVTDRGSNGNLRFCAQCGNATDSDDKFCAYCGHNLTLTTSTKIA